MNEKNVCLRCKKYRMLDGEKGLCRLKKVEHPDLYPQKKHDDSCENWVNCGQQYYIRTGWLKKNKETVEKNKANG